MKIFKHTFCRAAASLTAVFLFAALVCCCTAQAALAAMAPKQSHCCAKKSSGPVSTHNKADDCNHCQLRKAMDFEVIAEQANIAAQDFWHLAVLTFNITAAVTHPTQIDLAYNASPPHDDTPLFIRFANLRI
jgi:hypothetical protein